jgi:hypothetical protein
VAIIKISELPAADTPVSPSDVVPALQNGVTKKAAINQFGFIAGGTGATTRTIQNKLRDIVSVKDFGAVGDGVTDDYVAIQAAIAAINAQGGGTLYFPYGTYFINQHVIFGGPSQNTITDFTFSNCDGLVIEGNGSTIQLQGGWVMTKDYTAAGFWFSYQRSIQMIFSSCSNVVINDLFLNGGAQTITKEPGLTAENSSHGITIYGNNQFTLNNVNVSYYCCDGMYIDAATSGTPKPITSYFQANNCTFTNNARQGCSIIQARYCTFNRCTFSYTGEAGTFGNFAPSAGVDIEPNYTPASPGSLAVSDYTGDIQFYGCLFLNNKGIQYVATNVDSVRYPVLLDGCTVRVTNVSTYPYPFITPATKNTNVINCYFDTASIQPNYGNAEAPAVNISGNTFYSTQSNLGFFNGVLVGNVAGQDITVDNNKFYFMGTTGHTGFGIYLQSPQTKFTNNYTFTNAALHNGVTYDLIHLVQQVAQSENNRWDTNLSTASKLFTVDYTNAVKANDYFVQPTYISPSTAPWPSNFYTLGTTAFSTLLSASNKKITYGTAAPTTGTWAVGDRVVNSNTLIGNPSGWVCTTAGTPGTWTVESYVGGQPFTRCAQQFFGKGESGTFTTITLTFSGDNTSGDCIADIQMTGFSGVYLNYVVGKYGTQAAVVMSSDASVGTTVVSSAVGGVGGTLQVVITTSVTHPVVFANCIVGGLSVSFTANPAITFA